MDKTICLTIVKDEPVETMNKAAANIRDENEVCDESVSVVDCGTELIQESLDQNCTETWHNVYDTSLVVCKEELRDGCLDKPEHSQADIASPADCQQTLECPAVNVSISTDNNQGNRTTESGQMSKQAANKTSNKINKYQMETDLKADLILHEKSAYPNILLKRKESCSKSENNTEMLSRRAKVIWSEAVADDVKSDITNIKSECKDIDSKLICNICNYEVTSKADIESHSVMHSCKVVLENIYQCGQCVVTKCKSSLTVHSKQHTGEKPYSCIYCNYKCSQKSHLVTHMRTHTGEKPYSCNLCSYKFKEMGKLNRHMRTHTGEKPFSCNICSYKCSQKISLVAHTRTHTGEKPYSCNLCSSKFKEMGKLNRHMRTHTEKSLSCNICSYKCHLKNSLVTHMTIHTGEKPYFCYLCSYKFRDRSKLNRHMRTHTGEKPYSCYLCSYTFWDKSKLNRHMRTHPGEIPFSCNLCQNKYGKQSQLVRHMRTHTEKT